MPPRIMAVDDDRVVLKLIEKYLGPEGVEVLTFTDSLEAAQQIESQRFDAILLDVEMPRLGGFDLAARVRESRLNSNVPTAMLTSSDNTETRRRALQAGITLFVGKPVTPQRLLPVVHAMLGYRRPKNT